MNSLTDRSLRTLRTTIDRLESFYGTVPILEKTWHDDATGYEAIVDRFERGCVGGAGVWVRNDDGEILLARETDRTGWGDPGGKREPGETFEETACREVREETGVECTITDLLEIHAVEHRHEAGAGEPIHSPIVIFDGEYVDGTVCPREGEIAAVEWFAEPPATLLYEEVGMRPYPATETSR
ncbi:NUDIX hydrolase [Halocatena halophila]|uniref:NUDIX hydrolase n=1 Tax=Halocatena halophila TaxID=2814576 RepID=UPI002ED48861